MRWKPHNFFTDVTKQFFDRDQLLSIMYWTYWSYNKHPYLKTQLYLGTNSLHWKNKQIIQSSSSCFWQVLCWHEIILKLNHIPHSCLLYGFCLFWRTAYKSIKDLYLLLLIEHFRLILALFLDVSRNQ